MQESFRLYFSEMDRLLKKWQMQVLKTISVTQYFFLFKIAFVNYSKIRKIIIVHFSLFFLIQWKRSSFFNNIWLVSQRKTFAFILQKLLKILNGRRGFQRQPTATLSSQHRIYFFNLKLLSSTLADIRNLDFNF